MLSKADLIRQRGDLSEFLVHMTRSGSLKKFKDLYSLENDDLVSIVGKDSLIDIIKSLRIEARSPFGYFNYLVKYTRADGSQKNVTSKVQRDWLKAVCFTETPINHVHLQTKKIIGRRLHFEPYGLAFKEHIVRKRSGNPLFYVDTRNKLLRGSLDSIANSLDCPKHRYLMPFVEGFGPPWYQSQSSPQEVDFRWEREWRVVGDFMFALGDVAFGFCPEVDIPDFESLVSNKFPFVDPNGDIDILKIKLRKWPHLADLK
jgi:hypothetical protein